MDYSRRFARQVRLGFGLIALLAALVGIMALLTLNSMLNTRNYLISERTEPMLLTQQLVIALEKNIAASRGYIISPDAESLNEIRQTHEEFQRVFAQLQRTDEEARVVDHRLTELGRAEGFHQELLSEGFRLRRAKRPLSEVLAYWAETVMPNYRVLTQQLTALLRVHQDEYRAATEEVASAASRSIFAMVLVVGIAILVILLLIPLVNRMLRENSRIADELRRTHDQLRETNEQLEERIEERTVALSAANKELEAFSYSVSHDLRAPLRGIDGFSQALLEDYGERLDAEARDYLQRIRAGVQRMGRLIDDLLALSRLTRRELNVNTVRLSDVARRILEDLKAAEPERNVQTLIRDVSPVVGDEGLLAAAMENLLMNSWKFTSKRADARIEFGQLEQPTMGEAVFFVKDNGAGFDMAYADKLFGAFQRLHGAAEFSGTGVGLATVRRILHRHGGRIWAEGEVGKGATFYFTVGNPAAGLKAA
ncbi:MAG: hypothetical protein A2X94_06430 [Bdellovibrionales bacterium GWB1_55_8]|nr:MAG: hypothetical protein A2X94_06430 [Bdellovibrionales bacterium GWB1_55_8]